MQVKSLTRPSIIGFLFFAVCNALHIAAQGDAVEPLPLSQVRYWAYHIQDLEAGGAINAIVNSRYDMVVIDPTVTHSYEFDAKDMVNRIKASKASDRVHRKLVLAYIDIGEAEEWRWYWDRRKKYEQYGECKPSYVSQIQSWAPWVVACDPDGWAGNYPVAFWDPEWKEIAVNGTQLGSRLGLYFDSLVDEVIQDGFDGVYLDWVEAWEMDEVRARAKKEGKNPAREMLKFIQEIRAYGRQHNPSFLVIQQNSSQLIYQFGAAVLKTAVDAIAQEGVWWDGTSAESWNDPNGYDIPSGYETYYIPRLRAYRNGGFPVFVCEYALKQADDAYEKAKAEGFIAYATRRALSRLTTTPPNFDGEVLYVDQDGTCGGKTPCYSTIEAAINAAWAGDTIRITVGPYNENVVVNKALTFEGGWNSSFTSSTSITTINGKMTVSAESTTVKNIDLRSAPGGS